MGSHTDRIIVLVDMDCFYCQVEEKLDPSLIGKPIAVAQYNTWKGGGLIAVNYPARDKGVTRHMRGDEAKEICPDIILVRVPTVRGKADLTKYREGGKRVAEVLQTFTPLLQRASIDEAYLDISEAVDNRLKTIGRQVTTQDVQNTFIVGWETTESYIENVYKNDFNNEHNLKLLVGGIIVEEIRTAVYEKTGYSCSAGVAHNKILAKLACGINKPNKQTLLPHESVEEMYKTLPIKKIKGLGAKFGVTLGEDLKIKYMSELAQISEKELLKRYDDKNANFLFNIARGINLEPVEVRLVSKSIGCCKRFPGKTALVTTEDVTHWLSELAEELAERLEQDIDENNRKAKQLVLSFAQEVNKKNVHSSRTLALNSYEAKRITEDAFEMLKRFTQKPDGSFVIKFLGLSAGKFENTKNVNEITSFFKNMPKNEKGPIENQKSEGIIKKPRDLAAMFKNMDKKLKEDLDNQNGNTSTNFVKENDPVRSTNINTFLQNMAKTKIIPSDSGKSPKNRLPETDSFDLENVENQQNNAQENKIKNILSYFDKNLDPSQNFNSTKTQNNMKKPKGSIMNFFQESQRGNLNIESNAAPPILVEKVTVSNKYQTIFGQENYLNLSSINDELNLSDIENDAQNHSDTNVTEILMNQSTFYEDFSDSTVEGDYTELLAEKTEFPFKSNQETVNILEETHNQNSKSPILGKSTASSTGNSFFMRYIKKMETKTEKIETQSRSDDIEIENSDSSAESCQSDFDAVCSKMEGQSVVECIGESSSWDSCQNEMSSKKVSFTSGVEPIAGSSKDYQNDDKSLDSIKNETFLPVEVIYSQESNTSTNFDDNIEVCSECGENVAKNSLISHMDHHLALKLMDEEKKLFQQELELVKQRRLNKSPTVKELIKSRIKNKSVKRKQPDNNTNITSFFVQKPDETNTDTEVCEECGKCIEKSQISSHLDFHAAKKLHLELNPVKVVAKNQFKVVSKKINNTNNKNIVNNNISLTNFFKPK